MKVSIPSHVLKKKGFLPVVVLIPRFFPRAKDRGCPTDRDLGGILTPLFPQRWLFRSDKCTISQFSSVGATWEREKNVCPLLPNPAIQTSTNSTHLMCPTLHPQHGQNGTHSVKSYFSSSIPISVKVAPFISSPRLQVTLYSTLSSPANPASSISQLYLLFPVPITPSFC